MVIHPLPDEIPKNTSANQAVSQGIESSIKNTQEFCPLEGGPMEQRGRWGKQTSVSYLLELQAPC